MFDDGFAYGYGRGRGGGRRRRGGSRGYGRGYGSGYGADYGADYGYGYGRRGSRRGGGLRFALLALLKAEGGRTSAQLTRALAERGYGRWLPDPVAVSVALRQLEDAGLIRGTAAEAGSERGFELTDTGTGYLNRLGSVPGGWWPADEGGVSLRQAIAATNAAARQVAFEGGPDKPAKAAELLNEARKGLYRLLSGESE
jgi:DNA-binding PadR family transcriptional regulator